MACQATGRRAAPDNPVLPGARCRTTATHEHNHGCADVWVAAHLPAPDGFGRHVVWPSWRMAGRQPQESAARPPEERRSRRFPACRLPRLALADLPSPSPACEIYGGHTINRRALTRPTCQPSPSLTEQACTFQCRGKRPKVGVVRKSAPAHRQNGRPGLLLARPSSRRPRPSRLVAGHRPCPATRLACQAAHAGAAKGALRLPERQKFPPAMLATPLRRTSPTQGHPAAAIVRRGGGRARQPCPRFFPEVWTGDVVSTLPGAPCPTDPDDLYRIPGRSWPSPASSAPTPPGHRRASRQRTA